MKGVELGPRTVIPISLRSDTEAIVSLPRCLEASVGDELPLKGYRLGGFACSVLTDIDENPRVGDGPKLARQLRRDCGMDPLPDGRIGHLVLGAHIIGEAKNKTKVYAQRFDSHAATHLRDTPNLPCLVSEAISRMPSLKRVGTSKTYLQKCDMRRIIGASELVEVHPGDDVFYAKRAGRHNYIPFVNGREMEPTKFISIIFRQHLPQLYELYSAWIGVPTPAVPGTHYESKDSRQFWSRHALVVGRQEFDKRSVTRKRPW